MDMKQTSCCTVVDKKSQTKFICYTRRKNGILDVCLNSKVEEKLWKLNQQCLTDAADVWSSEFTTDTLDQFRHKFTLKSTDDFCQKFRSASSRGAMSVVVHGSSADLCVGPGPADLNLTLNRLEGPQAKEELKELLFKMADSLTQTDSDCVSSSTSPVKNPQRRNTDFEPRQQNGAPSVTLKKRLPGASLINPGAKKKLRATGVAFDDADED